MPSPSAPSTSATRRPAERRPGSVLPASPASPTHPESRPFSARSGAGEVHLPHHRHDFQRAGGGAGERRRFMGAWRSCMTTAAAPKAAAERRMAPTLRGSVTWSSTSDRAAALQHRGEARCERFGEQGAPGAAHPRAGSLAAGAFGPFRGDPPGFSKSCAGDRRIRGGQQPAQLAARVGQRRDDRVQPVQPDAAGGRCGAAPRPARAAAVAGPPRRPPISGGTGWKGRHAAAWRSLATATRHVGCRYAACWVAATRHIGIAATRRASAHGCTKPGRPPLSSRAGQLVLPPVLPFGPKAPPQRRLALAPALTGHDETG